MGNNLPSISVNFRADCCNVKDEEKPKRSWSDVVRSAKSGGLFGSRKVKESNRDIEKGDTKMVEE